MRTSSTRTKGKIEELKGRAKTRLGGILGNEKMQVEGTAKTIKGTAMQEAAKVTGRVRGTIEAAKGRMRRQINK